MLSLLEENNVVNYLSRHTHKTVNQSFGKILLVSGETTSKNFDQNSLGFRVWKVTSDTIQQRFVPLELKFLIKVG